VVELGDGTGGFAPPTHYFSKTNMVEFHRPLFGNPPTVTGSSRSATKCSLAVLFLEEYNKFKEHNYICGFHKYTKVAGQRQPPLVAA